MKMYTKPYEFPQKTNKNGTKRGPKNGTKSNDSTTPPLHLCSSPSKEKINEEKEYFKCKTHSKYSKIF
jgi:hypothetical protein